MAVLVFFRLEIAHKLIFCQKNSLEVVYGAYVLFSPIMHVLFVSGTSMILEPQTQNNALKIMISNLNNKSQNWQ